MSLRQKYLRILAAIVPAGAVGVSVLLGATAPGAAREHPDVQKAAPETVSERLAAIREAVSALDHQAGAPAGGDRQLAWGNWWRNWGGRHWGWPNWHNWPNWRNWGNWWHNW
jgi:hypothetical protein